MTYKYSRQREAILNFVKDRKDHPTADAVYDSVRAVYPSISLGTVYRNLTLLKDMGKLQMIDVGDHTIHFDPNTEPHDHFVCSGCGSVLDIGNGGTEEILSKAGKGFAGRIDSCKVCFYGLCPECMEKESQKERK